MQVDFEATTPAPVFDETSCDPSGRCLVSYSIGTGTLTGDARGEIVSDALPMPTRGARRRPAFGSGSLTPTERSVALLVAAGRTNAEIAAEMLISIATVTTHLTHAFTKLGVTNRTQLARVVADRS